MESEGLATLTDRRPFQNGDRVIYQDDEPHHPNRDPRTGTVVGDEYTKTVNGHELRYAKVRMDGLDEVWEESTGTLTLMKSDGPSNG